MTSTVLTTYRLVAGLSYNRWRHTAPSDHRSVVPSVRATIPHARAASKPIQAGRWLDVAGVAVHLSCGKAAVWRLARAGKLPNPTRHLGPRSPRWDRDAIDAMIVGRAADDDAEAIIARAIDTIHSRSKRRRRRDKRTAAVPA